MGMEESLNPTRRWFRISLLTMLVLVTLVCIYLGWSMNWIQSTRNAIPLLPIAEHQLSQEQKVKDETDQAAKQRFCKLLEKHGMQRLIPVADQYMKPSIRISLEACGSAGRDGIYRDVDDVVDESEVGESKFGGFPD